MPTLWLHRSRNQGIGNVKLETCRLLLSGNAGIINIFVILICVTELLIIRLLGLSHIAWHTHTQALHFLVGIETCFTNFTF